MALRNLARLGDQGLAACAKSTLAIIADIRAERMSEFDLLSLSDLVESIFDDNHRELLAHLKLNSPDCAICAALVTEIENRIQ